MIEKVRVSDSMTITLKRADKIIHEQKIKSEKSSLEELCHKIISSIRE